MIWPNAAASYIVITVGVAFLIPGVISLFGYFGRKRQEGEAAPRFPIEGIGSLLFGLWLIVMPEFFHGKDWEVLKPRLEKSNNSEFWISKISRNRERDDDVNKQLLFLGWTVIRFWGDDIKKNLDECVRVIEETIFETRMGVNVFDLNLQDHDMK